MGGLNEKQEKNILGSFRIRQIRMQVFLRDLPDFSLFWGNLCWNLQHVPEIMHFHLKFPAFSCKSPPDVTL